MKKMFLTIAAALTLSAACATTNEKPSENNLMMDVNMNSLSRTLRLSNEQQADVKTVQTMYNIRIQRAVKIENEAKKQKAMKRAMNFNLANMKATLSDAQYRKYLQLLNTTLRNREVEM